MNVRSVFRATGVVALLIFLVTIFQNCSPIKFSAKEEASINSFSIELDNQCNPTEKPTEREAISCPTSAGNQPLISEIFKTRKVYCVNGDWITDGWVSPPIASCGCAVSEMTANANTGICSCPTGKSFEGGRCVVPACDLSKQESLTESKSCPENGLAYRSRSASCNMSTLNWSYTTWSSWNYSQCGCNTPGAQTDAIGQCSCPIGQNIIGNSCGTCPTNFEYNSSTRTCDPKCTQSEVLLATKSYFLTTNSNETEVANQCIDSANPNLSANLPTTDSAKIRFFNTCGNRYCAKSLSAQGYTEGRIVESYGGAVTLECRKKDPPPTVSDSCRQKLLSLPQPIVSTVVADSEIGTTCIDPSNPTLADNIPEAFGRSPDEVNQKTIRWIFTCSARYCKSKGYSSGRMVERSGGVSTLNCYNEEIFNSLNAGTIVARLSTTVHSVSTICVDTPNPSPSNSYPSVSVQQHLRFVNTCGRRYCNSNGYSTGYITEIAASPSGIAGSEPVTVLCIK
jgi:hypothetical protein